MKSALILTVFGLATVLVGVWLIYPPAAIILGGLGVLSAGLRYVEWDEE